MNITNDLPPNEGVETPAHVREPSLETLAPDAPVPTSLPDMARLWADSAIAASTLVPDVAPIVYPTFIIVLMKDNTLRMVFPHGVDAARELEILRDCYAEREQARAGTATGAGVEGEGGSL